MASHSHYRIEHVAMVPRGWKVRTVESGSHLVRIAFPPGRRQRGAGHVVEILHPKHENPCPGGVRLPNPAELVLLGANPHSDAAKGGRHSHEHNPARVLVGHGGGLVYFYKKQWGKTFYSYDGEKTWHESKREALEDARSRGELQKEGTIRQSVSNPTRTQRIRSARERSSEIRRVHEEFRHGNPSELWAVRWHTGNISQPFRSKAEAEGMLRNFHGKGELIRVNPLPASTERYRNPAFAGTTGYGAAGPSGAEAAEAREIREGFVHADTRGYRVVDEPLIPSGDYAELGTGGAVRGDGETAAAYLAVRPRKGGYRLQIGIPKGVTFLSDTTRRQIWIAGAVAMSEMEVAMFTDDARPSVNLGECVGIGYIAVKYHPQIENHAAGRRILWEHEFGEENGIVPHLIYDRRHERLALEGGDYTVKDEGIVN